jgi:uncharacterized SAM-binding protein YcdF (DUF218 family)
MANLDSYMFMLKKFIGGLLMPMPLILLLLIWALLFLLRKKTRWLGILVVAVATSLLFVSSYPPLVDRIIAPLEQDYSQYQVSQQPAEFIAVLGSGHTSAPEQPITSEMNPTGIVRLTEGIRIYRLNPGSKLIFTGYHGRDSVSYSEKIKQLAIALGVPQEDILAFSGPRDTAEEAQLIAEKFADTRLVLVTSASHMPRAMTLFAQVGLAPTPAPTGHLAKPTQSYWLFPSAQSMAKINRWLHEQLGLLWTNLLSKARPSTSKSDHQTSTVEKSEK